MDMARYTPSQQALNVEDDYLTPTSDIPYYINLAIAGPDGIIVSFEIPITITDIVWINFAESFHWKY